MKPYVHKRVLFPALLAGLALIGLLAAPAAVAAPKGRIVAINVDGDKVSLVFSATGLDAGQSIDPKSVVLSKGGTTIPSTVQGVGTNGSQDPTAILVMDISGSMQGARLDGAKLAAKTFVSTVPPTTKIGLVTFSTTAQENIKPTTDRQAVTSAIDGLSAQGSTSLYDAVNLATGAIGPSGPRTIVVFSDGADTSSKATLPSTQATIKRSGVTVDAVSLGADPAQVAALRALAVSGKGQVITANNVADLTGAFSAAARDISNQVTINGTFPAAIQGTSGNLDVSAQASGAAVNDSVYVTVPQSAADNPALNAGPRPVAAGSSGFSNAFVLILALLLLFAGLIFILIIAFSALAKGPRRKNQQVERRLSIYTLTGRGANSGDSHDEDSSVSASAKDIANKVMVSRDFDSIMAPRLERAGIPIKSGEWLLIHIGLTLTAAILMLLLSGGRFFPAIVGVVLGVVGPFIFLTLREERRQAAFQSQLPQTLQLLAGSLASGLSLPQSIDTLIPDASQPMSGEMRRAIIEARLGVQMETALEAVATRMKSIDFSWVVMAIRIQREVGGNLAEVLTTVAATMRERERLRRQVSSLSAEGRLSAWILGALPVVFTLFLLLTRPDYLAPLFNTPLGLVMLTVASILLIVGILWLVKLVKVEV